jgi:hypothetical protein
VLPPLQQALCAREDWHVLLVWSSECIFAVYGVQALHMHRIHTHGCLGVPCNVSACG